MYRDIKKLAREEHEEREDRRKKKRDLRRGKIQKREREPKTLRAKRSAGKN